MARTTYVLTRAGYSIATALNPTLPAWRPIARSTFLISHSLVTADVALAFQRAARANPGHEVLDWECDWQTALRLGSSLIVPDGHLVYATAACEIEAFIEADLGTEGTRFFAGKITRYLDLYRSGRWRGRLATWPVLLTVTTTAGRARILRRTTETVLAAHRDTDRIAKLTEFRFSSLADLLGPAGPLGEIWHVAGQPRPRSLLPELPAQVGAWPRSVRSPLTLPRTVCSRSSRLRPSHSRSHSSCGLTTRPNDWRSRAPRCTPSCEPGRSHRSTSGAASGSLSLR